MVVICYQRTVVSTQQHCSKCCTLTLAAMSMAMAAPVAPAAPQVHEHGGVGSGECDVCGRSVDKLRGQWRMQRLRRSHTCGCTTAGSGLRGKYFTVGTALYNVKSDCHGFVLADVSMSCWHEMLAHYTSMLYWHAMRTCYADMMC